jgi:hypothetical protein
MKSYEVTYTQGHLVDTKTGKRIFLKRGGRFNILGDDDQFDERDELVLEREALGRDEKYESLQKKYGADFQLVLIRSAGEKLLFRIGLSKKHSTDPTREFLFDAYLLEDLYIRSKETDKWSLCECLCETRNCVDGELQMIEPVIGYSLNNLFSNMVAFYFPLQRSGSCNAFNTFHLQLSWEGEQLPAFKAGAGVKSLDRIRQEVITISKDQVQQQTLFS